MESPSSPTSRTFIMGRVYTITPDISKSERSGMGYRVYTHTGSQIGFVSHVVFDTDADRGLATVSAVLIAKDGQPIFDPERNACVPVTFRAWVQIVKSDEKPTIHAPDDLLVNPSQEPGAEKIILWSDFVKTAEEMKA